MCFFFSCIVNKYVVGLWTRLDFQFPKGKISKRRLLGLYLLIRLFWQAYFILDELLIAGELQESSKKSVLRVITQQDQFEEQEVNEQKSG